MDDIVFWMSCFGLVLAIIAAVIFGRGSQNLSRMEIVAAVTTAKREVGWTYEKYRIEALRMEWMALAPEVRKEYIRAYGRPKWTTPVMVTDYRKN
jgi:hypothetical protein